MIIHFFTFAFMLFLLVTAWACFGVGGVVFAAVLFFIINAIER